jgi:hypothetical protein
MAHVRYLRVRAAGRFADLVTTRGAGFVVAGARCFTAGVVAAGARAVLLRDVFGAGDFAPALPVLACAVDAFFVTGLFAARVDVVPPPLAVRGLPRTEGAAGPLLLDDVAGASGADSRAGAASLRGVRVLTLRLVVPGVVRPAFSSTSATASSSDSDSTALRSGKVAFVEPCFT